MTYRLTLHRVLGLAVLLAVFLPGPAVAMPMSGSNNPSPVITGVTIDGSGVLAQLAVGGSGFVASSIVLWDGTPLPTTFLSDTELAAEVPSSYHYPGSTLVDVSVFNPAPGGGATNVFPLTVQTPFASVTALGAGYLMAPAPFLACTPPILGETSVVSMLALPVAQPLVLFAGLEAITPIVPAAGYAIHIYPLDMLAIYGTTTDQSGALAVNVPIPSNPILAGDARVLQAVVADPALPLGFTLTNAARLEFGY